MSEKESLRLEELTEVQFLRASEAINELTKLSAVYEGKDFGTLFNLAAVLHTRLAMTVTTSVRIFHKYQQTKNVYDLDHFSIAGLARTAIDTGLTLLYFSQPRLSQNDWDVRLTIMKIHELTNQSRFDAALVKMGFDGDYPDGDKPLANRSKDRAAAKKKLLEELRGYWAHGNRPVEDLNELIKRNQVYLEGYRGAVRAVGWNVNDIEARNVMLSNFIHSHPASYFATSDFTPDFNGHPTGQLKAAHFSFETLANILFDCNGRISELLAIPRPLDWFGDAEA